MKIFFLISNTNICFTSYEIFFHFQLHFIDVCCVVYFSIKCVLFFKGTRIVEFQTSLSKRFDPINVWYFRCQCDVYREFFMTMLKQFTLRIEICIFFCVVSSIHKFHLDLLFFEKKIWAFKRETQSGRKVFLI